MKINKTILADLDYMMNEWKKVDHCMSEFNSRQWELNEQGEKMSEEYNRLSDRWSELYDEKRTIELDIIRKFNECLEDEEQDVSFNECGYFYLVSYSIEELKKVYLNAEESFKHSLYNRAKS